MISLRNVCSILSCLVALCVGAKLSAVEIQLRSEVVVTHLQPSLKDIADVRVPTSAVEASSATAVAPWKTCKRLHCRPYLALQ